LTLKFNEKYQEPQCGFNDVTATFHIRRRLSEVAAFFSAEDIRCPEKRKVKVHGTRSLQRSHSHGQPSADSQCRPLETRDINTHTRVCVSLRRHGNDIKTQNMTTPACRPACRYEHHFSMKSKGDDSPHLQLVDSALKVSIRAKCYVRRLPVFDEDPSTSWKLRRSLFFPV
jgi:hypothetical protein